MRFVEGGLSDLSISRTSFDWGVKVPGSEGHVMYVWVDALTNYLTGLGYPEDTTDYRNFWREGGDIFHIIGKDIVRFHAVRSEEHTSELQSLMRISYAVFCL